MARRVLMAEVSGGWVRGRPRLGWMDGVTVVFANRGMTVEAVCINTYLDTWSGFEAAKTAPWPSRGLHHCGKFLEPSDE